MPHLIAGGLTLLALLVLFIGFRLSRRMRRPKLFELGSIVTAIGIMLLWLSPLWLISADRGAWSMPMFIGVIFVAVSVLSGGLQLMRYASGAPGESPSDRLLDEFLRQNDLP